MGGVLRLARATALLILTVATSHALADSGDCFYSFILRDSFFATNPEVDPGVSPNTIFTYDPVLKLATVGSTRLADEVELQLGPDVLVDAMTYGYDACCLARPHGEIHFSAKRTSTGRKGAAPFTGLWSEPPDDCEADLFWVPHVPFLLPYRHTKSLEENDAVPAPVSFPYFREPQLGLTGSVGVPRGVVPGLSNVGAFDHHPVSFAQRDIYFSIDRPAAGYFPGDILVLTASGTITTFQTYDQLGLSTTDDIDALSIDIFHSFRVGQSVNGLFSVTRESTFTTGCSFSGANIFQFVLSGGTAVTCYRPAPAMGMLAIDGEIDGVISIDPLNPVSNPTVTTSPLAIVIEETPNQLTTLQLLSDELQFDNALGTASIFSLPPLDPGDRINFDLYVTRGDYVSAAGAIDVVLNSSVPPPTDLDATINAGNTVIWTWTPFGGATGQTVSVDGEPPQNVLSGQNQFVSNNLAPGFHFIEIRTLIGGDQSDPAIFTVFIDSPIEAPEAVEFTISGPNQIDLEWSLPSAVDETQIFVDGVLVEIVASPATGANSTVISGLEFGVREITLRNLLGTQLSLATGVTVFLPRPAPGTVVQSLSLPTTLVTGVAVDPLGGTVYIAQTSGLTLRFSLADFTVQLSSIAVPGPNAPVLAIAWNPASSRLIYALGTGATPQLWSTDGDGASPIFEGDLNLPSANVVADLSFDSGSGDAYLVAVENEPLIYRISTAGTFVDIPFENPLALMGSEAIASRLDGEAIVPAAAPNIPAATDIISLAGGPVITSIHPLVGTLQTQAIAWTAQGSINFPTLIAFDSFGGNLLEIASDALSPNALDCHDTLLGGLVYSSNSPLAIPDNDPFGIVQTLVVPDDVSILDLDVSLRIEHTQMTDITVELISPSGTTVQLQALTQIYFDPLEARYDDLFSGGFNDRFGDRPAAGPGVLADFDGEAAQGSWTLVVRDNSMGEIGTLLEWSLLICPDPLEPFIRGDANADLSLDLGDALFLLAYLFDQGGDPSCFASADANDSGDLNLVDPIFMLLFTFAGGPLPPPPSDCLDPPTSSLDCAAYPCP